MKTFDDLVTYCAENFPEQEKTEIYEDLSDNLVRYLLSYQGGEELLKEAGNDVTDNAAIISYCEKNLSDRETILSEIGAEYCMGELLTIE